MQSVSLLFSLKFHKTVIAEMRFDSSGGFTLVLQVCIYHALIKLIPFAHHLITLYHHAPLILSG
jgi:hypothetical protein